MRLTRSDAKSTENLGGWLTTVVARVCLDMLRSRKSRKEESLEEQLLEAPENLRQANPADESILADSVGSALLIVLRTLTPAERVAFVLHDLFDLPFEEIAPIVGRSEAAARQLNGKIQGIDVVMAPEDLKEMEVKPLGDPSVPTLDAGEKKL